MEAFFGPTWKRELGDWLRRDGFSLIGAALLIALISAVMLGPILYAVLSHG